MQSRIAAFIGANRARYLWASTFHSVCLRLLRSYAQQAGLAPGFSILDRDAQVALIKRLMKDCAYGGDLKASELASKISDFKEKRMRAQNLTLNAASKDAAFIRQIYALYERECQNQNLVDFSELLLRCVELLEQNEEIRNLQHRRFREILVDEFQDTNSLQFTFLKLIKGPQSHIMAVGDDDQSIYGWRGADISNIMNFEQDYPDAKTIMLEQNYRSTKTILAAANAVIENNSHRKKKNLWTDNVQGDKITTYMASDERDEARFITESISKQHDIYKTSYGDIAILYRTNAQSRVLEDAFMRVGLPYTMAPFPSVM